jgi:hypothetical protein
MRNASLAMTAICWIAYGFYETFYISAYCKNCDIRVDLLIIAPVLLVLTTVAIIGLIRNRKKIS